MMTPHTVVLMAALVALLGLPCALVKAARSGSRASSHGGETAAHGADSACSASSDGADSSFRGGDSAAVREAWARRARRDRPWLHRLDKHLADRPLSLDMGCRCDRAAPVWGLPTFDQTLAELRRLDRQRLGGISRESEEWARSVVGSYDRWLQVACTYLSVSQHLACLTDTMDREIERLRVEAELIAAGLPPIRGA